ncbi:MAG TPA: DUF2330 domain-containing protein [Stellaceae bacterium]|nr:DUF2330 domain-containing protein [Stellaceae bacterium]
MSPRYSRRLKSAVALGAIAAQLGVAVAPASAFCGFYVAQADSKLFNKSSKVVLAWDEGKTSVTMVNDYEGDPKEFAIVIPVPTFLERKQIGVVDMKTVDHLDAFTAPRLVEYFDEDPCTPRHFDMASGGVGAAVPAPPMSAQRAVRYAGVTVEASYDVAEYDVSILSAEQSDGLVNWLTDNGYRIPDGAEAVLASYIKQKMHFFVAKVNLERMELQGSKFLRPLQVRYETKKFMLPLRLGTVNANGPQDLIVLALTRKGRVETSNYRTVKVPSDVEVPLYVKEEFPAFYKAMFQRAVDHEDMRAVFVEYAWDMGWCDPCAAEPLKNKEFVELGARWIGRDDDKPFQPSGDAGAYVTRLHVRYDAAHFPEDLAFQETRDRSNFQGRYILRHPYEGRADCRAGDQYLAALPARYESEAMTLAQLTGWNPTGIRARMEQTGQSFTPQQNQGLGPWIRRNIFRN